MEMPDIFALLSDVATVDQMKVLLRTFKKDFPKEILISGAKSDVLDHLQKGVDAGRIPISAVHALLSDCEENGRQHIFFFQPKAIAVKERCNNAIQIGGEIWGSKYPDSLGFPKYVLIPNRYEWADFRVLSDGKNRTWTAKTYGQEVLLKYKGQEKLKDGRIAKYFQEETERVVCLARWDGKTNTLQMRIGRCDSKTTLLLRLNKLWEMLKPAFNEKEFERWDLVKARKAMVRDRVENQALYSTGALQLRGSRSGWAEFHPDDTVGEDELDPDNPDERTVSIDAYIRAGATCDHLVAKWQPVKDMMAREVPTVIGGRFPHELYIPSQTTSQVVDYVTDQLREFGK
jgi:hypothetical protein